MKTIITTWRKTTLGRSHHPVDCSYVIPLVESFGGHLTLGTRCLYSPGWRPLGGQNIRPKPCLLGSSRSWWCLHFWKALVLFELHTISPVCLQPECVVWLWNLMHHCQLRCNGIPSSFVHYISGVACKAKINFEDIQLCLCSLAAWYCF